MKFINYLESITGVGIFPLTALVIFIAVFVVTTVMVIKTDRKTIEEQKRVPLD